MRPSKIEAAGAGTLRPSDKFQVLLGEDGEQQGDPKDCEFEEEEKEEIAEHGDEEDDGVRTTSFVRGVHWRDQ